MATTQNLKAYDAVAVRHPDGGNSDTGQVIENLGDGFWLFSQAYEPFAEYEVHESRLVKQ